MLRDLRESPRRFVCNLLPSSLIFSSAGAGQDETSFWKIAEAAGGCVWEQKKAFFFFFFLEGDKKKHMLDVCPEACVPS